MKQNSGFIPYSHCTVASGDCFHESKCLADCSAGRKKDHESRIRQLERDVVRLSREVYELRAKQEAGG